MLIQNPPAQISDSLWMLGIADYPLYLLKGGRQGAIFEGGIGPAGGIVRDQLRQLDVPPDSIAQVVITHAHPDHVMAVPAFRSYFPRATVLASELAAKTLSAEKAVAFFCKMDDALADWLIQEGLVAAEHRRGQLAEQVIAVDRTLKEGDVIEIDGLSVGVLETPGHSDCSLSFFEPSSGTLILSDATGYYFPERDCWWPNYFANYGAYVDSMKRLAKLEARVLCLSHKAAIHGREAVQAYLDGAIAATEHYHQRILDDIQAGQSAQSVAEQLGREIHQQTPRFPLEFFQKNCSLLVKLSLQHAQASGSE
jgi:glyoxylase-like metal-dependent hydrolase (beta-lactamase superfamily II)